MPQRSTELNLQGMSPVETAWLGLDGGNPDALNLRMPGSEVVEWASTHRNLLTLAGIASSAPFLSGCVGQVLEAYGSLGTSVSQQLEALAKSPVEIIIPLALIGGTYGVGQAAWWAVSSYVSRALDRGKNVEAFETTDAFQQLAVIAKGQGLIDGSPEKAKALAEFLEMVGLGGGKKAGKTATWPEFVKRLKVIPLAELQEWGKAGALTFGALYILDAISKTPEGPGKAGLQLTAAGVAIFALLQGWEAVKPFKYQ